MKRLFRAQVEFILVIWDFRIVCAVIITIMLALAIASANTLHGWEIGPESFINAFGWSRYGLFLKVFKAGDFIFPVACSLAVGASFAIDRKTRVAQYILTRGFRKWQYLLAKGAAMMLCSMLLIVLVQGVTWIASTALAHYPTVQPFEAAGMGGSSQGNLENLLFHRTPGRYVLMIALLQLLAAGAIATAPLLIAVLGGNAWTVVITPIVLWFLSGTIFNGNALMFLYPGFRTSAFWWWRPFAAENTPCPPFLRSSLAYWAILLLFNAGFAALVYLRQEDV